MDKAKGINGGGGKSSSCRELLSILCLVFQCSAYNIIYRINNVQNDFFGVEILRKRCLVNYWSSNLIPLYRQVFFFLNDSITMFRIIYSRIYVSCNMIYDGQTKCRPNGDNDSRASFGLR